ncbi:MAG: hypothetical protein Q9222_004954 [Ikaeria aurantiellina]
MAGSTGTVSSQTTSGVGSVEVPLTAYEVDPAGQDASDLFVFKYPAFPQRPVKITQDWAKYLNPYIPAQNTTVFELILRHAFFPETSHVTFDSAITAMVVNGLARIGMDRSLQGSIKSKTSSDGTEYIDGNFWVSGKGDMFTVDPDDSKDWVKLEVNSFLEGYAYNTQSAPPIIAIVIMTIYCVLALGHMLYATALGISSSCWDSAAEMTALAINSTPTAALRNTCAGINEMHVFKLPVRVLAMKDAEGEEEHLELVFGSVKDDEKARGGPVKTNQVYGTMPDK